MDENNLTQRIIGEVRPFSMVPDDSLAFTINTTIEVIESGVAGDIVECGTWLGGASFAMLLVQRYKYGRILKPVWMLDSFQGLPPADTRDGAAALQYQANKDAPDYYDNCTAPLPKVIEAIERFGFSEQEALVIPGWFDQTIPLQKASLKSLGISVLRVDCDWYEPVKYVLDELAPLVSSQGTIILDDYYSWDGCALATHEFLAENRLPLRIRSLPSFYCAWIRK
jgi:hypothetical protein